MISSYAQSIAIIGCTLVSTSVRNLAPAHVVWRSPMSHPSMYIVVAMMLLPQPLPNNHSTWHVSALALQAKIHAATDIIPIASPPLSAV